MGLLTRVFKQGRPPAEALAGLDRDERVTAWATTPSGDVAVATPRGLWLAEGAAGRRRLAWNDIHKATWGDDVLTIVPGVEVEPGVVVDAPHLRLQLAEPRDLPAEVRSRVTRSVAYSTHHTLPGGGVRIVARRVPGVDGLTWVLRFDEGTDRADPEVRQRAAELLDDARAVGDVPH
jgi:hypothetical protein